MAGKRELSSADVAQCTNRFWASVDKSGECWPWIGFRSPKGYGWFSWERRGEQYNISAHRMSYLLSVGPIPEGKYLCHRCDNPSCVRPDHLFIGTPQDNVLDSFEKGRRATGEQSAFAKLKEAQVLQIYALAAGGMSQVKIGKEMGISQVQAGRILNGRNWKHLHRAAQAERLEGN